MISISGIIEVASGTIAQRKHRCSISSVIEFRQFSRKDFFFFSGLSGQTGPTSIEKKDRLPASSWHECIFETGRMAKGK
jgi:hypothetical protein